MPGAKDAVGKTTVIADGGYRGTNLVMPHRREKGQNELPSWKPERLPPGKGTQRFHCKVRARVENAYARMKRWKISHDCRLKSDGVHHAMLAIARPHNLTLTGLLR